VGSFALAGALEGLGKGLTKAGEMQHSDDQMERASTLQEARDNRLAALRAKYAKEAAGEATTTRKEEATTSYVRDQANTALANFETEEAAGIKAKATLDATAQKVTDDATVAKQKQTDAMALQGKKDTAALARVEASYGSANKARWSYKNAEGGEASDWADVTQVFDSHSAQGYIMAGDRFTQIGMKEGDKPEAPQRHINVVLNAARSGGGYKTPDGKQVPLSAITARFLRTYGWLPTEVFQAAFLRTPGR